MENTCVYWRSYKTANASFYFSKGEHTHKHNALGVPCYPCWPHHKERRGRRGGRVCSLRNSSNLLHLGCATLWPKPLPFHDPPCPSSMNPLYNGRRAIVGDTHHPSGGLACHKHNPLLSHIPSAFSSTIALIKRQIHTELGVTRKANIHGVLSSSGIARSNAMQPGQSYVAGRPREKLPCDSASRDVRTTQTPNPSWRSRKLARPLLLLLQL